MNELIFAAVADDDTGASDLAGMLVEGGLRTLLVIDLPSPEQFTSWSEGYDAVVMAEGTRNLAPAEARERTRAALRILEAKRPRIVQIKYCSTFDSTSEGNIGQSIETALDELHEKFTIALPALPVNGRTTYQGYHFVNGRLLSDSPMRHHPLTPMTNADLVALLDQQTDLRVGLAPYNEVEAGAEKLKRCFDRLQSDGISIALVDCLNDNHLETICQASADLPLITGSSAFGMKMPTIWRERGWFDEHNPNHNDFTVAANKRGCLFVAGSCSVATREQNEWLRAQGVRAAHVSPIELLSGNVSITALACAELGAGRHFLLTTTNSPEEVRAVQDWGARNGLSVPALGGAIAYKLAHVVREIVEAELPGALIVAGGETSGALCRRLELGALRVGRNIEPGVPLCFSLGRFRLPVILKSGNFGGRDFYGRASRAAAQHAAHMV